MREIITLQIGNCGNQVGRKFWQALHREHGLDADSQIPTTIVQAILDVVAASINPLPQQPQPTQEEQASTTNSNEQISSSEGIAESITTTTSDDNNNTLQSEPAMPKPIEATQTPPTAASTIEAKLSSQSTNKILDELYRGLNIFYDEGANGQYVPRTIMADLDHSSLDSIMSNQEIGKWFRPDYSLGSTGSSGNNWAKGYYTEGPELAELVMDVVRKSAESCDCIQGFQIFHSIGGGCGSGMGCFITNRLQDEYGGAMIMTNSVFPSTKTVDSVLAPYNSVLTLHHLIQNVQMVNCFDNHALNQISQKLFRIESPEMVDLNEIVAQSVAGMLFY